MGMNLIVSLMGMSMLHICLVEGLHCLHEALHSSPSYYQTEQKPQQKQNQTKNRVEHALVQELKNCSY